MYYLLVMQNVDTENVATSMTGYNSREDVFAAYHTELAYRHSSRVNTICMILDAHGNLVCRESYGLEITE